MSDKVLAPIGLLIAIIIVSFGVYFISLTDETSATDKLAATGMLCFMFGVPILIAAGTWTFCLMKTWFRGEKSRWGLEQELGAWAYYKSFAPAHRTPGAEHNQKGQTT